MTGKSVQTAELMELPFVEQTKTELAAFGSQTETWCGADSPRSTTP